MLVKKDAFLKIIILTIFNLFFTVGIFSQSTIWSEDFETADDLGKGCAGTSTCTAPTSGKWSLDKSGAGMTNSSDYCKVTDAGNMNGSQELQWKDVAGSSGVILTTESISISSYSNVSISANFKEGYCGSSDYLKFYSKIDGGSEVAFTTYGENTGSTLSGDNGEATASVSGLSGSTLQIIIKGKNGSSSDMWYVDDIIVSGTPTGPYITTGSLSSSFSTCYGTVSSNSTFTVEGINLTGDITVTAPAGYEVSTSSGSGFGGSVALSPSSGTVSTTTIYARLSTTATLTTTQNFACTSSGATTANLATGAATINSNVLYVSTSGSNSNSGVSSSVPLATIRHAIDIINTSCGSATINLADGIYDENDIDIDLSVSIIGESEAGTIIDNDDASGEYCFKVTTINSDVTLQNLTIRDFKDDAGCAFYSNKMDNKMVFNSVTFNSCYINSSSTYDGVVFIYYDLGATTSDGADFINCTFSDNYSAEASYAVAITIGSYDYDYDYKVTIEGCVFDNNDGAGAYGSGVVDIDRGYSVDVKKCIFKNNTGHFYSSGLSLNAIGSSSGTADRVNIENCLFHDNSLSFAGAALTMAYCNGDVFNCTFAQNSNTNGSSYYVSNLDITNATIAVKNCIFQSDDSGNEMISGGTLSYCIINGGAGDDTYTDGGSNSTSDPLFSDAASNDFTLTSDSPAFDAGTSGGPAADILGVTRDGSPDMGCYEYSPNNWTGTAGSAWANSSNWSRGTVPGTSENITIPDVSSASGNTPVITSDVSLGGITINSGASLTISSNSLIVTGTMDINDNLYIDNATVNADGTFDATGGTIDFTNANGKLILSSTVTSLGNNLDAEMGTVEYDGATQTVFSDNYNNLTISTSGTKTAGGAINIDGALTTAATAGSKLDMSTYALNAAGNITVGATDGLDVSDALSIVTFDGSSDQTVTHEGSTGGSSTVTLVSEDFNSLSTGSLTESVSTTSTYQNVADCTSEKWEIESSDSDYAGSCSVCSGNRAHIEYYGSSCTQDNTIITAEFSPTTLALEIRSNYAVRDYGGQYFEVYLYNVTDATQVDTDLINITSSVDNQTYSAQTTLSGSNSTSDSYSLRFHYYGNNDYGAQFDNVLIQEDVTTSGAELNNCTINKSGGNIILNDVISVDGTLTLTAGDIDASSNNLVLTSAAIISGGTDAAHVIGTMIKTTEATSKFTFPVGDGNQYKAISITPQNGTSTEWSAKYFGTAYPYTNLHGSNAADIDHVSTYEYWDLTRVGSDAAKVEIPWVALNEVETYADLRLAHWDGSAWEHIASAAVGSDASGNLTSSVYQDSFSPFTLGSSSTDNVLPIELVSFSGEKKDNRNILNWTTASEINNAFFTVEKSYNGIDFQWVGTLEGTSPSAQIINYSLTDYNILETLNYYRLKQTDFDGKFEYSNTISIDNRVDNSFKEIIGRTNLLGQDVDEFYNGIVIVSYKDGTSQKFYQFK